MTYEKFYTDREEKANYLSHALGVLIAITATIILLWKAISAHNYQAVTAYTIFGLGMFVCMLSSTIYHFEKTPIRKAKLRHFDHASIYLLIAASYSPFTLVLLRETPLWGLSLFCLVWIIAIIGIGVSFGRLKRNNHLKTISYVAMGLIVMIAFKPLIEAADKKNCIAVIYWLMGGGVFYIVGAIIYAKAKREFVHAIFHIFVLMGLICHIISAFLIPL